MKSKKIHDSVHDGTCDESKKNKYVPNIEGFFDGQNRKTLIEILSADELSQETLFLEKRDFFKVDYVQNEDRSPRGIKVSGMTSNAASGKTSGPNCGYRSSRRKKHVKIK